MTRQQTRRIAFKAAKARRAEEARVAAAAALKAIRAQRREPVKQGPGTLTMIGRAFKKPHGVAGWRRRYVRMTGPLGVEVVAELHTTKGYRSWRLS